MPEKILFKRAWAMPNKNTFTIKPIKRLLNRYVGNGKNWIDPFCGLNSPAEITNDLNPKIKAGHHFDAGEFCKNIEGNFGWNSNGFGKKRGFEIIEILLVAHGGHHNDTIVTVEKKVQTRLIQ